MGNYRRPWWLLVNKSNSLNTTIQEENRSGQRVFIIRGEPLVQGLAWLTWGPISALLTVFLLVGLAVSFNVKAEGWGLKALFVFALLSLPALAWGGATIVLNQLSKKHLAAEREADSQQCIIRLDKDQGELFYQTTAQPQGKTIAYQDIQRANVAHPIGERGGKALNLRLDTNNGPIILLNEMIGTQAQKLDLAQEIQEALKGYAANNKNHSSTST